MIGRKLIVMLSVVMIWVAGASQAQPLRQMLIARMKAHSAGPAVDPAEIVPRATRRTLRYGQSPDQTLDVYAPPPTAQSAAHAAPVIVMVHGGGWRIGDKSARGVVENKLRHWLPKGFVFVSVNYRMLPEAGVDVQAEDVARATAFVQNHASEFGGDGGKVILMGHSAGAHLVALLSADPSRVRKAGGRAWRGTVVLDSAGLDVARVMGARHPRLFDDAFGAEPAFWRTVSPTDQLKPDAAPMMLICALKRPDDSCDQSEAFQQHLASIGQTAPLSRQDLTHAEVNNQLGLPGDYTAAVDRFIDQLLTQS